MRRLLTISLLIPLLLACKAAPTEAGKGLHESRVLGSHNSYKQPIDPSLLTLLSAQNPKAGLALDYSHPPLREQLEHGLRAIELDVFHDPNGGHYGNPLGISQIDDASPYDSAPMSQPGFKVMHVQDIDFRSHCQTLEACIATLVGWSSANPEHHPIFVTINAKTAELEGDGFAKPFAFDTTAWDELDATLSAAFGQRLITPAEIQGRYATLNEAVLAQAWPSASTLRGRYLVVLDEGGDKRQSYLERQRPHAMFTTVREGHPQAAIRIVNDPVRDAAYIAELVSQGYIVRTRADADTVEARAGTDARMLAAIRSGAQIISTDYYLPDPRFGTGYVVPMAGFDR